MSTPRVLVEGGPVDRHVKYLIALIVGLIIGASGAFGVLLVKINDNSITNCRQIEIVKDDQRATFAEAQRLTEASKGLTAQQKEQSTIFYRDALGRLKPRKC